MPRPIVLESKSRIKFEHVIIVPVYNECPEDVLRLIYSVAIQRSGSKHLDNCAIVININNSTLESKCFNGPIYRNNLNIFNFIKELVNTNKDLSQYYINDACTFAREMVVVVRDLLMAGRLYIDIIDSFSSENTRDRNTLGFAREFATRYAVNNLVKNNDSLLFSTDADCIFANEAIAETDKMFLERGLDLAPLNMDYHFYNLDSKSCQSAVRYRLYRMLVENLVDLMTSFSVSHRIKVDGSILLKKIFNIGGSFTVMRAGKYAESSGYPDGFKEDLYIVANVRGSGGIVGDFRKAYPKAIVYTSPRQSDRVTMGYGAKIADFSRDERDFFKYKVTDINAHLDVLICIRGIEKQAESGIAIDLNRILTILDDTCPWIDKTLRITFSQELEDIFSGNPFELYNDAHWNLSNKTKKILRSNLLPQQTILDQINLLESIYRELDLELLQLSDCLSKDFYVNNFLSYDDFKKYLFSKIKDCLSLDINYVFSLVSSCVAAYYMQLYIPRFKEVVDKKNKCPDIRNILRECEARLLEAVIYGCKGDLDLKTEAILLKRFEAIIALVSPLKLG